MKIFARKVLQALHQAHHTRPPLPQVWSGTEWCVDDPEWICLMGCWLWKVGHWISYFSSMLTVTCYCILGYTTSTSHHIYQPALSPYTHSCILLMESTLVVWFGPTGHFWWNAFVESYRAASKAADIPMLTLTHTFFQMHSSASSRTNTTYTKPSSSGPQLAWEGRILYRHVSVSTLSKISTQLFKDPTCTLLPPTCKQPNIQPGLVNQIVSALSTWYNWTVNQICPHFSLDNVIQWATVQYLEGGDCINLASLTNSNAEDWRDATFVCVSPIRSASSTFLLNFKKVCGLHWSKLSVKGSSHHWPGNNILQTASMYFQGPDPGPSRPQAWVPWNCGPCSHQNLQDRTESHKPWHSLLQRAQSYPHPQHSHCSMSGWMCTQWWAVGYHWQEQGALPPKNIRSLEWKG